MSVLPPYFSQTDQPFNSPQPAGIANGLTWTASSGIYIAYISNVSPLLQTTSVLSCAVQTTLANVTDSTSSWLQSCTPLTISGGSIQFQVNANPTTPNNFPIAWEVVKY